MAAVQGGSTKPLAGHVPVLASGESVRHSWGNRARAAQRQRVRSSVNRGVAPLLTKVTMAHLRYSANIPASDLSEAQAVANALNRLIRHSAGQWLLTIAEPEGAEYWETILQREHAGNNLVINRNFHGAEREADHVFKYLRDVLEQAGVIGRVRKPTAGG